MGDIRYPPQLPHRRWSRESGRFRLTIVACRGGVPEVEHKVVYWTGDVMWFSAKILYQSQVDDRGREAINPLCEESIIVIDAEDQKDALEKAVAFGQAGEHSYKSSEGQDVAWKFVEVMEVQDLCEERLESGVEVHSRLFRKGVDPE